MRRDRADILDFALEPDTEYFFDCLAHIVCERCNIFRARSSNIDERERVSWRYAGAGAHVPFLKLGVFEEESRGDLVGAVRLFPRPGTQALFF